MLGLPIVAYLFLGGAGAGSYLTLSVLNVVFFRCRFRGQNLCALRLASNHPNARLCHHLLLKGYVVSFLLVAAGSVCLLCDMGKPESAYMLFTNPTASYITVGSFSILALLICCTFHAAASAFTLPHLPQAADTAIVILGILSSTMVMGYTGAFLRSITSVAIWDSNWLIALFLFSSLSTGIAVVMLVATEMPSSWLQSPTLSSLAKIDILSMIAETIACAAHLLFASQSELGYSSVKQLIMGEWAPFFIGGFVICGLAIPLLISLATINKQEGGSIRIASALVLFGGFCLRLSIFEARFQIAVI